MFQPVIPAAGLAGWSFLQRTYDDQIRAFSQAPAQTRLTEYFSEKFTEIRTAQDLVSDRRLLEVALGAFGLQDDIDNRYFIRKMLEEGTTSNDALANRFSDRRYSEFVKSFGLGPGETSRAGDPGFAAELTDRFLANSFEVATGQQDDTMRVALYAQRTLADLAGPAVKSAERIAAEEVSAAVDAYVSAIEDDTEYFERNIGSVESVADLLADSRLLKFSLEAFGLGAEFAAISSYDPATDGPENEALTRIERVLSEGTVANISAANQLDNPAYADMSRAFGFGIAEDRQTGRSSFPDRIIDRFIQQNFVIPEDIGFQGKLIIADRAFELEPFRANEMSNDAKWLTIMGEPPLRALFEKALNLPGEFGQVDIDQQLTVFKQRAQSVFGSDDISQFAQSDAIEDLIQKYIVRSQIDAFTVNTSSASIALAILQN